jgi:hypothetical protein
VFPTGVRTRTKAEALANLHRKPDGLSGPGSLIHQHIGKAYRLIRPGKPEAPTLRNNLIPGYIITALSEYILKMYLF